MDSMYWWGKNMSVQWYDEVIYLLGLALDNDIEGDRKEYVRAMISVQVRTEIHMFTTMDSMMAAELLWINWIFWFNATYKNGPKLFHGMTQYSVDYVRWSIAQLNYHAI
jgi:hypothetical protein